MLKCNRLYYSHRKFQKVGFKNSIRLCRWGFDDQIKVDRFTERQYFYLLCNNLDNYRRSHKLLHNPKLHKLLHNDGIQNVLRCNRLYYNHRKFQKVWFKNSIRLCRWGFDQDQIKVYRFTEGQYFYLLRNNLDNYRT